jgi:hypothetical protein
VVDEAQPTPSASRTGLSSMDATSRLAKATTSSAATPARPSRSPRPRPRAGTRGFGFAAWRRCSTTWAATTARTWTGVP